MIPNLFHAIPPGAAMFAAAFALPFLPSSLRHLWMLLAIAVSATTLTAATGDHLSWQVLGLEFVPYRIDALSFPFSLIFHIAAVLMVIYSWHLKQWQELMAQLSYAGAAILALHAGDLLTLFFWWEATAITSVFIIMAGNTKAAEAAAWRYLMVQVTSGVLLLGGAALRLAETGSLEFTAFAPTGELQSASSVLILLAFGIKAAFPFLNGWLQDAYPESTPTGTVALSAFTTKLAIYALLRGFPGLDLLIWIGAAMTALPVFFAVIENDLRRVLSFSLNNQLGFMVVAAGIGTPLAINGGVAHAFVHIIYKALLFMSMGSVMYHTGTTKATELGGLYRHLPFTMVCCIIGALSISAAPLFSGYVAKTLTFSALGDTGLIIPYLVLLFASAGVLEHSGIKIPYFTFFAHPSQRNFGKTPTGMLVAMGVAAAMCIGFGFFPDLLYQVLPYSEVKNPYDLGHVSGQLQLLVLAALAFVVLVKTGLYPPELRSVVLNSDWFYRRLAPCLVRPCVVAMLRLAVWGEARLVRLSTTILRASSWIADHPVTGPVIPGPAAFVQALVLLLVMIAVYVSLV